jgi:predicted AAA+ superfamily ATPase
LRSQGLALSKDSLYNYLGYLEESFVVFPLPVAERSLRKQAMNPKKLHAIDWALAYSFVAEPSIDVGKKLETAVFLHWRRQREDLGYLAGEREVDLVVNRDHPEHLINVSYSVSLAQTWKREIAALEEGAARFPRAACVLVAHERTTRKPPTGIEVVDAWRYLLGTGESR